MTATFATPTSTFLFDSIVPVPLPLVLLLPPGTSSPPQNKQPRPCTEYLMNFRHILSLHPSLNIPDDTAVQVQIHKDST